MSDLELAKRSLEEHLDASEFVPEGGETLVLSLDSHTPVMVLRGDLGESQRTIEWVIQYRTKGNVKWHDSSMVIIGLDQGLLVVESLKGPNPYVEHRLVERTTYEQVIRHG